jgi:hypothetical protein
MNSNHTRRERTLEKIGETKSRQQTRYDCDFVRRQSRTPSSDSTRDRNVNATLRGKLQRWVEPRKFAQISKHCGHWVTSPGGLVAQRKRPERERKEFRNWDRCTCC